jgi:hypothetical protein
MVRALGARMSSGFLKYRNVLTLRYLSDLHEASVFSSLNSYVFTSLNSSVFTSRNSSLLPFKRLASLHSLSNGLLAYILYQTARSPTFFIKRLASLHSLPLIASILHSSDPKQLTATVTRPSNLAL